MKIPYKTIEQWQENLDLAKESLDAINNGEVEEYVELTKIKLEIALGIRKQIKVKPTRPVYRGMI